MTIINDINTQRFSFNGVEYYKNFTPVVVGNKIRILNVYDSSIELTSFPTLFSDFEVDGNTFLDVESLQSALLPVLYTRSTLSGGGSGGEWGSITGTLSDQTDLQNALNGKLPKSTTPSSVYATNALGNQEMISKDSLGSNSFTFSQRSARLSASLTAGNWNGFVANTNFAVCNFPTGFGASILAITDVNLRGMNGYVIDGITVKMLNYIDFIQPTVETGINFDIQIWKYDFLKNGNSATALNLRKVVDYNYTAVANSLTGHTDKIVSTDATDTPINHFSKYIIFLRTNAGASFIYPNIDWNFKI
jgi:hypothetical protein